MENAFSSCDSFSFSSSAAFFSVSFADVSVFAGASFSFDFSFTSLAVFSVFSLFSVPEALLPAVVDSVFFPELFFFSFA